MHIDFNVRKAIDAGLRRLLREVVLTLNDEIQATNLVKVYQWYYSKLIGIGDVTHEEQEEVSAILDPEAVKRLAREKEEAKIKK